MCVIPSEQPLSHSNRRTNRCPNQRQTHCYQSRLQTNASRHRVDLCEDYRELVTRLRRLADNLAGAFVVASGDSARALEAELRMFEEAIDVLAGSMLPEVIEEYLPSKEC